MSGFKLLAIRPLKGCSSRFRKNLQPQVIYKFYNDYNFVDKFEKEICIENDNLFNEIETIMPLKTSTQSIYSSNNIQINISAIVGQNGSGKSSLIDFYNLIIYYLSCHTFEKMPPAHIQKNTDLKLFIHFLKEYLNYIKQFLSNKDLPDNVIFSFQTEKLNDVEVITVSEKLKDFFELERLSGHLTLKQVNTESEKLKLNKELWRLLIEGRKNYGLKIEFTSHQLEYVYKAFNHAIYSRLTELIIDYKDELEFENLLSHEFNFQLFYQKDEKVYSIHKLEKLVCIEDADFYYNILLNYSLHSMNSEHLGEWIFKLFHKNDGYQTPIVINPYREHGVIDINVEQELTVDRLIYNIVDQFRSKDSATILGKYQFKKFILKLKTRSAHPLKDLIKEKKDFKSKKELIDFVAKNDFQLTQKKNNGILDYCLGYLIKKFKKISMTYMNHFFENPKFSEMDFSKQLDELQNWQITKAKEYLLNNHSHVTRKFDQTLNYIVNQEKLSSHLEFINHWDIHNEIEISTDQLERWVSFIESTLDLKSAGTNEIISNLFPAIFNVDIEFENNGSPIKLSDMSSGERQYIFNINTITYHINNLKTIQPVENSKLKKYDHVNIILDEIELYYHPQYQKQLVKDITAEIKKLDTLGDLKNFNLQFLTHSPFILSDIPKENILKLVVNKNGKSEPQEMNEETFGANIHDLLANDFFLKDGFMGEFAKGKINETIKWLKKGSRTLKQKKHHKTIIELIGEPILKRKLLEMYDDVCGAKTELDYLRQRVKELESKS